MKIGIIGGGAIGLLTSAHLARKHDVTVYVRRKEQKEALNRHGVLLEGKTQSVEVTAAEQLQEGEQDLLIVCVKQSHISFVLSTLQRVNEEVPVIFLQNGMGHTEQVKHIKQPVILGTVSHGALKIDDCTVSHTGRGVIYLAPYDRDADEATEKVIMELDAPDFHFEKQADWYAMLIDKLIVNAVINPVTSLFRVKNKQIVENPYLAQIAKQICRESAAVLQVDFDDAWKKVQQIALATGENTSSMLKDIQKRRKTEVEGITGYILRKNKTISLPYSRFIYDSIKAIEDIEEIKE